MPRKLCRRVVAKRPITRFTTFELQRDTGFVLQWSPTNDLTNSNILNPIATPTQNTNYQLVAVTNTHACPSDTLSIAVNVNEFTVNTIPDTIICNGESICLIHKVMQPIINGHPIVSCPLICKQPGCNTYYKYPIHGYWLYCNWLYWL